MMKIYKKNSKLFSLFWVLMFLSAKVIAQDIHFTQFFRNPLQVSPGLSGVFNGDTRLMFHARNQWREIPVDYKTVTLSFDTKLPSYLEDDKFWSLNGGLTYDLAGDSRLQQTGIFVGGGYTKKFSPKVFGTIGLNLSGNQRGFDPGALLFDRQYDPSINGVNASAPNGEGLWDLSKIFFDAGMGANIRIQADQKGQLVDLLNKRSKVDIGVGVHHLFSPNTSFFPNAVSKIPMRLNPYVMGVLQVSNNIDLTTNLIYVAQAVYNEWMASAGFRVYLDKNPGNTFAIDLNVNYQQREIGNRIAPSIEMLYRNVRAGFSYDINLSKTGVLPTGQADPEIFVHYVIKKIPRFKTVRVCPLI
ncbi:MAG: PorP/SprF family type IX secretion system membrane protein [Saprospiraceae bacterium]|jgi:type IX secretion system PorP/SprF family membrane protein|nr:PorP/SprF family type IX secretion system membrane protein [Saprospiraceae bacterium]